MQPIAYFSLFEESKKEFTSASNNKDVIKKLESAKKLMEVSYHMTERNYMSELCKMFNSQSHENSSAECREMFANWAYLAEESLKFIELAAKFYQKCGQNYINTINIISSANGSMDEYAKEIFLEIIENIKEDPFFENSLNGIECIVNGMVAPLTVMGSIVRDFLPDSYLLKEEQAIINLN